MNTVNRVAFNTVLQYIQLVVNVIVGLFTVRIVLRALGEVDYGVYNVVGGIITLITFISTSLSQTSVRFLSVSIGRGDKEDTRKTFSSCFSMHLYMAITLCVVLEIVGLFLFDGFLNIPEERIFAAKCIFHCMTVTLFLHVSRTPAIALITAHEQFHITTSLAMLNSVLKLVIAIIISHSISDRLIVYGLLMMALTIMHTICYWIYDIIKYKYYLWFHFYPLRLIKEVFSFAGWTLLDVFSSVANRQGYQVVLNKFFGPVTNSVFSLAGQVEGHLFMVSRSVITTIRPQIMKSYGAGDVKRTLRLSMTAGKLGFSMMSLLSIPILITLPELLELWLGNVPEGTVFFARMMVIACMFEQITRGLVVANQAIGNIKWFSIIVSSLRVMALPAAIIMYLCGLPASYGMYAYAFFEIVASFSRIFVMKYTSGLDVKEFLKSVYLQIIPPFMIALLAGIIVYHYIHGLLGIVIVTLVTIVLYGLIFYFFGLSIAERNSIISILKTIKSKFKHS